MLSRFVYILSISFLILILASCANIRTRSDIAKNTVPQDSNTTPQADLDGPETPIQTEDSGTIVEPPKPQFIPKIGLILGPGAMKSFAHIGFLQELTKAKIPVHSIVGLELSSLIASIYAQKGQSYDVEWQMFKIKEDVFFDKSLITGSNKEQSVTALNSFISEVFKENKVEDFKLSFGCPTLSLTKHQNLIMSKGSLKQLLPYCLAFPPLWTPYNQGIAGVSDIKSAADFLRAKGANYIIYVNALGNYSAVDAKLNPANQIIWELTYQATTKHALGIDDTIQIATQNKSMMDYSARREFVLRGSEAAKLAIPKISKKLGL